MTRLARVILAMVIDSYGLAHRSDEIVGTTDANFRMLRYCKDSVGTSPPDEQPAVALAAHVDGSYLTVLFQNDVDGFELRTRNGGEWVRVRPPGPDSLLVVAGQALMVSHWFTTATAMRYQTLQTAIMISLELMCCCRL
jgi:isopenicillin N synthase-like dioxygenase